MSQTQMEKYCKWMSVQIIPSGKNAGSVYSQSSVEQDRLCLNRHGVFAYTGLTAFESYAKGLFSSGQAALHERPCFDRYAAFLKAGSAPRYSDFVKQIFTSQVAKELAHKIPKQQYGVRGIVDYTNLVAQELKQFLPKGYKPLHEHIDVYFADLTEYVEYECEVEVDDSSPYGKEVFVTPKSGDGDAKKKPAMSSKNCVDDFRNIKGEEETSDVQNVNASGGTSASGSAGSERPEKRRYPKVVRIPNDEMTLGLCCKKGEFIIYHEGFLFYKIFCGKSIFEVVLHEVYHWFEHELERAITQEGYTQEDMLIAYKYGLGFERYLEPWHNGFEAYKNQLVEVDAETFSAETYKQK